ncbi:UDP-N-acetylmuramoyl-tripeptide--D-alanyl-D-alanine ligase [Bailinhaonella thermotolerans]|uniref:UDP-N-acetylmuramoyl-tripeptide--D-alanyl-D-alanine ligase n=1 Tax=Bailinhaonella thermotolerans TaxID=1070861 RepID=A0A3A4B1E8_9ACTN|nr:UDP-N-acetylmuramoyl-tripeptide--D-alanyl-D-alanine ligase [Bailinhaonella thermotolerans]RJL31240.1 UDP-N-acetylmuramoyl-tripeptide--D-alanyl-D-alanine ligase [Bailinhaonella thermotolerans]
MIPLTLGRIAEVTGGVTEDPGVLVTGPVVIDSREAAPGALFVAIKGARVDGHDFAAGTVAAGAAGVLCTRPVGVPCVVVEDVQAALAALASAVVRELPEVTIVGVTGSAGKTSTKDLLAQLTERLGPAIAPAGSFNNEIGHPLTVLRADADTRYLVLELSARNVGHIAYLARIAPPRVGVVLNVGTAHLGVFGGKEQIARAKGELVEALPEDGAAVLNHDDDLVRAMASRTRARVTYFGRSPEADVRAEDETLDARGCASFTLVTPGGRAPVTLRLHGSHAVLNALAAAAAAHELGMAAPDIAAVLSEAEPRSRWRMEVRERPDGVTVINDAYNANPDSVRAAFAALQGIAGDRRKYAVLAALQELGDEADALNEEVAAHAAAQGLEALFIVGEGAEPMLAGAPDAVHVPDVESAAAEISGRLRPGDVVLVKGPRVAGLERVAQSLLEVGQ